MVSLYTTIKMMHGPVNIRYTYRSSVRRLLGIRYSSLHTGQLHDAAYHLLRRAQMPNKIVTGLPNSEQFWE